MLNLMHCGGKLYHPPQEVCTAVSSEMLKTNGVKSSAVFIFAGLQIELTLKPNSEV